MTCCAKTKLRLYLAMVSNSIFHAGPLPGPSMVWDNPCWDGVLDGAKMPTCDEIFVRLVGRVSPYTSKTTTTTFRLKVWSGAPLMTPISPISAADVANMRLHTMPRLLAFLTSRKALCMSRQSESAVLQTSPVRITLVCKALKAKKTQSSGDIRTLRAYAEASATYAVCTTFCT